MQQKALKNYAITDYLEINISSISIFPKPMKWLFKIFFTKATLFSIIGIMTLITMIPMLLLEGDGGNSHGAGMMIGLIWTAVIVIGGLLLIDRIAAQFIDIKVLNWIEVFLLGLIIFYLYLNF